MRGSYLPEISGVELLLEERLQLVGVSVPLVFVVNGNDT
jgi:hypothetical protein